MKAKAVGVFLVLMVVSLSGCISTKAYVDPAFTKASYNDINRRVEPLKWLITGEFQRNGEHVANLDKLVTEHAERVIRASGVAVPTTDNNAPEIKIIVNNIADIGAARGKGFATGLTFGAAGNTVTDYYEMEVRFTGKEGKVIKETYKHAIHTTVGNASGPQGVAPMTPSDAFTKVVEQMLLNALKQMQDQGLISFKFILCPIYGLA